MRTNPILPVAALAAAVTCATPAMAQGADQAALRQELETMRSQMERMASRIDQLERQLAETSAQAEAASQSAQEATAAAADAKANPPVAVQWKGAPKLEGKGGWSFKPRGRLQYDAGIVSAPDAAGPADGFGNEARRARLGVEGDIPGGFGYKFEADFAANEVEIADAILTYEDKGLTVAVGQHNNFQGLEELTSSLFSSFIERAAFTDAFGFERRTGVSLQYAKGPLLLQGGVFGDNMNDLSNNGWSLDGRAVFMPKLGGTQLHLGGSVHYADLASTIDSVRYRQRPLVHFTGTRYINTGTITADNELGFGLEAAAIAGPFHAVAEGFWQKVGRSGGLADPTFFGGYAEVGYFLTGGDTRGYKGGKFDRVKPSNPVNKGGIGAVQVNLRYDRLDLSDAGIVGGTQDGFGLSVVWTPTDYTRFMASYMRLEYDDAFYPLPSGSRSYGVDSLGLRAQVDF